MKDILLTSAHSRQRITIIITKKIDAIIVKTAIRTIAHVPKHDVKK